MHLKFNEISVMKTAFSVLPAQMLGVVKDGFVMVIGNMQGQRSANQEIKIVTQKMERTRPQNILMTALQGLASGWGLIAMVGVSDSATSIRAIAVCLSGWGRATIACGKS